MKAKIRKANGWHKNHAVYEWQPPNSETWYLVRKDDLCVYTGQVGKSHYDLLRDFYNRLLQGEMITASGCRYFRKLRLLLIEYGGGREDGKIGQGNAEADPSLPDHQHAQHRPQVSGSTALVSNLGGDNMGKKKQKGKEKANKPETEKPKAPTDDEVLEALKQLGKAGSREISDKLGIKDPEYGRGLIRSRMKALADAGKVKVSKSGKQYSYEAA